MIIRTKGKSKMKKRIRSARGGLLANRNFWKSFPQGSNIYIKTKKIEDIGMHLLG